LASTDRIQGKGLTEEAKLALNLEQTDLPEIDLDLDIDSAEVDADTSLPLFTDSGDFIEGRRLRQRPLPTPSPRDANKNIPSIDEWMDFFSRIFLRVVCDWYISFAFRGIDEELLTDREVDRLQLTDEERKRIAVPLSELSHKSKVMRRYGRTIVASGGAFDALITLGTWASRVNRVASKYRKRTVTGKVDYERTGPDAQAAGSNGGSVAPGWTIINPGG
jgi:hypothetical protein